MGILAAIAGPLIGGALGSLLGGGGDDDGGGSQQPPGNPQLALLAELFSSTSALDAIFQNIAAREDPTIPALLNTQISRLGDIQGGGGFDANAFLSGDFSTSAPSNPLTLGGADSPFNVPFQVAGGIDPIIQKLIDEILTPATVTQGVNLGTPLTEAAGGGGSGGGGSGGGGLFGLTQAEFNSISVTLEEMNAARQENPLLSQSQAARIVRERKAQAQSGNSNLIESILGGTAQSPPLDVGQVVSGQAPPAQKPQFAGIKGILDSLQTDDTAQASVAQDQQSGEIKPILGSLQAGGTILQDGVFDLHRGETVLPAAAPPPPPPPPAIGLTPPTPPPSSLLGRPGGGGNDGGGGEQFEGDIPLAVDPFTLPGDTQGGAQDTNPLQDAIAALLGLVQGGGPITSDIARQQQSRINDVFGQQLQSSQRGVQEQFGARGLGGSGIEAALGLQQSLGLQENAARASNDLAVQQALQNFQGVQGAAQGLGGLTLGAGQFGLQQQQLQNEQQQQLIEFILQALQGTFAPGSGAQTINIV